MLKFLLSFIITDITLKLQKKLFLQELRNPYQETRFITLIIVF